ncbi:MAG: acyltransferase family protein [Thermodesulfobacteriota bacterium]
MLHNSRRLTRNNFDLLRLLFAGTVCLVHAHKLSGYPSLKIVTGFLSSEVAIKAFFVVSGFLIFMSFERSTSVVAYLGKRARRIYPAYFTVVMLCAIGLVAVSSQSAGDYFFSFEWIRYILANLAFLNFFQHTLPGVFETHKLAVVNGALWTLKIEVMFYLCVPLFVRLFRRFGHCPMIFFFYSCSVAYALLCTWMAAHTGSAIYSELGRQLPGQLSYFMGGALLYYYLPLFEQQVGYFVSASVLALVANKAYSLPLLEPMALAIVIVFWGLFLYLGNFGKYGDLSYGVYILHFPIIQLLLYTGWFKNNPWVFIIMVVIITTVGAFAMWHLVEKRFLLRSSYYVARRGALSAVVPDMALDINTAERRVS